MPSRKPTPPPLPRLANRLSPVSMPGASGPTSDTGKRIPLWVVISALAGFFLFVLILGLLVLGLLLFKYNRDIATDHSVQQAPEPTSQQSDGESRDSAEESSSDTPSSEKKRPDGVESGDGGDTSRSGGPPGRSENGAEAGSEEQRSDKGAVGGDDSSGPDRRGRNSDGGETGAEGNGQSANEEGNQPRSQIGRRDGGSTDGGRNGGNEPNALESSSGANQGRDAREGEGSNALPSQDASSEGRIRSRRLVRPETQQQSASTFFGITAVGNSFVYLIECSADVRGEAFARISDELMASLNKLTDEQKALIVLYSDDCYPMFFPSIHLEPLACTDLMRTQVRTWLKEFEAWGPSHPTPALKFALSTKCDAVIVLTSNSIGDDEVSEIKSANTKHIPIHVLSFGDRSGERQLRKVADESGGTWNVAE